MALKERVSEVSHVADMDVHSVGSNSEFIYPHGDRVFARRCVTVCGHADTKEGDAYRCKGTTKCTDADAGKGAIHSSEQTLAVQFIFVLPNVRTGYGHRECATQERTSHDIVGEMTLVVFENASHWEERKSVNAIQLLIGIRSSRVVWPLALLDINGKKRNLSTKLFTL